MGGGGGAGGVRRNVHTSSEVDDIRSELFEKSGVSMCFPYYGRCFPYDGGDFPYYGGY